MREDEEMNYIKEINAFMDWLEINPLEAITQTLWFHLMAIANKSGWPEWFTVANLTLQARLGVSDKTLGKHRNILIQKGRIEYRNQGKQQAGKYRFLPFYPEESSRSEELTGKIPVKDSVSDPLTGNIPVNPPVKCSVNSSVNRSALYKRNETKPNDSNQDLLLQRHARADFSNPFLLYEHEIGPVTDVIREMMLDWLDSGYSDEPEALLCHAIREAVIHEKRSWAYVNKVLQRCIQQGIRTVSQLEQKKKEFEARKDKKVAPLLMKREQVRREKVPSLILEQLERQKKAGIEQQKPAEQLSYEEKKAKMQELLRAMGEVK